jgi:hypothetical protein
MSNILMFLGEQIRRIMGTRDMGECNVVENDSIPNGVFADVKMAETSGGNCVCPIDTPTIIIKNGSWEEGVRETQIGHNMAEMLDGFGSIVSGKNFGFTGATASALLPM